VPLPQIWEGQANCRTHRPQELKCLISLCTNPVSIVSVPIQTVRNALNPLIRLNAIFVLAVGSRNPYLFNWSMSSVQLACKGLYLYAKLLHTFVQELIF
jgi:hypothetical protein